MNDSLYNVGSRKAKSVRTVAYQIYEISNLQFLLYRYLEESPNCAYISNIHHWLFICMNNRHIHLFDFLIKIKIGISAPLSLSIFLYPHPSIQKVLIYKKSSEKALNVCCYKNWIGCSGICEWWDPQRFC